MNIKDEGVSKSKVCLYKEFFYVVMVLLLIQGVFLAIKQFIFNNIKETLYSRSMVTMICMLITFAIMVIYCKHKRHTFSLLPTSFSVSYAIFTVIAVLFYTVTIVFVNTFSMKNVFMLFYSSIVTPMFEELLFRGCIWNRLSEYYKKEWMTYLVVTILFALWHVGYAIGIYLWMGGSLLTVVCMKVIIGGFFGFITGALRYKSKNCYLGILVHGILNTLG